MHVDNVGVEGSGWVGGCKESSNFHAVATSKDEIKDKT